MFKLADLIAKERIVELKGTSKDEVLKEMVTTLAKAPEVGDKDAFYRAIQDRESILSTGIGLGIAVPHAKIATVKGIVAALVRANLDGYRHLRATGQERVRVPSSNHQRLLRRTPHSVTPARRTVNGYYFSTDATFVTMSSNRSDKP